MRFSPFSLLFILLLSVPLIEIYLLISVGRVIGAGATIFVVIVTAILGAWLLRLQGLSTLARVQTASQAGQLPAVELVEGLILLVCGALLLTPGFFTDAIGFLMLVPSIRRAAAQAMLKGFLNNASITVRHSGQGFGQDLGQDVGRNQDPRTIEGDFRREDS